MARRGLSFGNPVPKRNKQELVRTTSQALKKLLTLSGFALARCGNGLSRRLGGTYSFRFGCTQLGSSFWRLAKGGERRQLLLEFENRFKEVDQFFHALQFFVRGKHQ